MADINNAGIVPPGVPVGGDFTKSQSQAKIVARGLPYRIAYIASHDGDFVVIGSVYYYGFSDQSYETDFCYYRMANGAIVQCEKHNDME